MGSPEGVGTEKYLSKRRKSESSHYLKARDWDDEEAYDEDRRYRSSKSKVSSRSDREREKVREKEKDREKERDHDRGDREGRSRDEYFDKGEKQFRSFREDRHEERAERDDREAVESRAGSSKRRNVSEKGSKNNEVGPTQEEKKCGRADYTIDVTEVTLRKHERAHDLEEEELKKVEPRLAKSREKERGRREEPRVDKGHNGEDEKYRRSDSRSTRGEGLGEDSVMKRNLHRERHYGKEEEKLWKESKAERAHDKSESNVRNFVTRAERFSETEDEKLRHSDTYGEENQNGETEDYQRAERTYEFRDSIKIRKGVYKAGRSHDIDDDTIYEVDVRHERATKSVTSSVLNPNHSKSAKNLEEKKSARAAGRMHSQYDEKDLRIVESQGEGRDRYVESPGIEKHPRISSRTEKSREYVSRDKGTSDKDRPFDVLEGGEGSSEFLDSIQLHKWDRKRNGSEKIHGEKGGKEESRRDWSSGIERVEEDSSVARFQLQEESRGPHGAYENILDSKDAKESSRHGRQKEKVLSGSNKPEHMLVEDLEDVIQESSREGNGLERTDSKWDEPEEDALSSRTLEGDQENMIPDVDNVDVFESEEVEECKSTFLEKVAESEQIVEYESQDFEKVAACEEVDLGDGERGDDSQLEKPERPRREKERLERQELDEWEKGASYKVRGERDWTKENRHFDQHLQGRAKSEWQDADDVNKLEGEMEEGGDEVPRSGRRRGRDTLEREDFDFESRFLGRDDKDRDRERDREREREKEREKERQRERDREREKERDRERDRGRERDRRSDFYSDDYQRKGSERYDERHHEYDIEGRSSGRGREYRSDHEREKFRSREAGREELDDRHRRLNSRDRREDERAGKLASKESTHSLVRGTAVSREKGDEERNRRLRSEEERGKKPISRDYIEESRLIGNKAEDPLDKVKAIGKDSGPDMSDDGGRLKGKHGRVITSPRSLDDRREPLKGGKQVMISRSPDDRKVHRSGKTVMNSRSPDDRRGGYRSGKTVTSSRSPDDRRGRRSSKVVTGSRSPEDRRGGRSDWEDVEKDWSDDRAEYDREKSSKRRVNQKRDNDSSERERDRYRSRERPHERNWERGKGKDKVDNVDRSYDRHQNHWKGSRDSERVRDSDFQVEQDNWETKMRYENADREKLERRMPERESSERNRMDRERVEGLRSPQGFASMSESTGRGHQMSSNFIEPGRGFSSHGGPFMPPVGDPGFFQGDYFGGMGEVDWDGSVLDDRMRQRESIFLGGSDRFMENEGPVGHDAGYGPGRGAAGDGGMSYSHHPGRGRASKASPNNRGRGGMMGHEGRPLFSNIQTGSMLRGMQQQQQQQGGKGRGPRGGPKGARGPGREVQRPSVNPLMGPGPGIGPHFGPMGPQGLMSGMGMGPGPGPGLNPGPNMGQFPLLPFGAPMGWGVGPGGGDMGMMGCPPGPGPVMGPGPGGLGPRFGPGMVPGPVPNMFFNPPGPGRGGHGGMPSGLFGGAVPPFNGQSGGGGRGQMGEKGTSGSGRGLVGRANGPPGRGPSRGEQNDYSQHFVDTGLRPQNFIRDVELADRFEEYPKLKELITRKDQLIAKRATPPMYLQCDLRTKDLSPDVFGTKFDVILVDPPWEEYVRRAPGIGDSMEWWSAEEIQNLRIESIADTPAFIFLWVGDAEGLEQGRLCLKKWGFRRCEDICWVKTNRENPTPALRHDSNTLFQHSKEHCLMGIRGTVRRSTDGHIIHANVDTDIIISEEPEYGSTKKPEELYHIIEHFAQGMRRIELFGEDHNIRAGWVTVGKGLTSSNFNPQTYAKNFVDTERKVWQGGRGNPAIDAPHLVGTTPEIEALRPKSPPPRPQAQPSGQGNAGNSLSQPSAGNSISKKASTGQPGGVQNGHPAALIPGAGHGSANPSVAGPVVIGQPPLVGGRGGGHGQIPKMRPVLSGTVIKPLGACPGLVEMAGFDEETSYGGDMQEATSAEDLH